MKRKLPLRCQVPGVPTVRRGLLRASFPGLCPLVRHYGDQFTGEPGRLFQGSCHQYPETSPGNDYCFAGRLLPLGRPPCLVL